MTTLTLMKSLDSLSGTRITFLELNVSKTKERVIDFWKNGISVPVLYNYNDDVKVELVSEYR